MNNRIVTELIALIGKGNAHATTDEALEGIPISELSKRPESVPYSIWELAEHLRIAQWDIVRFSQGPDHRSPAWPDDYWPQNKYPGAKDWADCVHNIKADREEMILLLNSSGDKLFDVFPYGNGQSLYREALVLADHNSYHTGQIVLVRKMLGIWEK